MNIRNRLVVSIVAALCSVNALSAQQARHDQSETETRGPKSGHLALGGGSGDEANNDTFAVVEKLARRRLKKGEALKVVVIPTAKSTFDNSFVQRFKLSMLAASRFSGKYSLTCLHTRDRKVADSKSFCEPLKKADLVVIPGGYTRLLEKAYVGTRFQDSLWNVLDRGGVVAGGSAGAIIQSSITSRAPAGKAGLNLLTNSVIDVHVAERNRQDYLIKMFRKKKFEREKYLGIGIDESVLAIITEDVLEVFGDGNVHIVNPREWKAGKKPSSKTLSAGDRYDLKNRKLLPQED